MSFLCTNENDFLIMGQSFSRFDDPIENYAIKIDSNGNTLWTKTYGNGMNYYCSRAIETIDAGYLILGYLDEPIGYGDIFLIKTDNSGNELWTKSLIGNGYEYASSIVQTSDGGFAIAGAKGSDYVDENTFDMYIVKLDVNGNF